MGKAFTAYPVYVVKIYTHPVKPAFQKVAWLTYFMGTSQNWHTYLNLVSLNNRTQITSYKLHLTNVITNINKSKFYPKNYFDLCIQYRMRSFVYTIIEPCLLFSTSRRQSKPSANRLGLISSRTRIIIDLIINVSFTYL